MRIFATSNSNCLRNMKISEVLAISGKPGLFKVIASSSKNLVVESMLDGKRISVPGSVRISSLSDITMYTTKEDVALREILHSMHKKTKGESAVSHNSSAGDIKTFVDSVVQDLDHERIFNSDLKKLVQWYNLLVSEKALPFDDEDETEGAASKASSKTNSTSKKHKGNSAVKKTISKNPKGKPTVSMATKKS